MKHRYQGNAKNGKRRPVASDQPAYQAPKKQPMTMREAMEEAVYGKQASKTQVNSFCENKKRIENIELADSIFSATSAIREINNDPYMHEKTTAIDALLDRVEGFIRPPLLTSLKSSRQSLHKRRSEAYM